MVMNEDKGRVHFYELYLAAMQIVVERKSVGFIDREGSSPSTPIEFRIRKIRVIRRNTIE